MAGYEYRAADEHPSVARSVKWWVSLPEWLRFGSAAHLLRVLSSCVDNLFRFWQCVMLLVVGPERAATSMITADSKACLTVI